MIKNDKNKHKHTKTTEADPPVLSRYMYNGNKIDQLH